MDVRARLLTADLPERLTRLRFRPDDRADALRLLPQVLDDSASAARAGVLADRLLANVGHFDDLPVDPVFEQADDEHPLGKGLVPLAALLATVDDVRAYHASRGIPDEVSLDTLGDLGQQVWVNRLAFDAFGLHNHGWECTVWRGWFAWLGRLQFHLDREHAPADADHSQHSTEWVLSCHIPATGPLNLDDVEASFAAARDFFARHFPDYPARRIVTHSWLADPTLAELLPPTSNIARFQRRWTVYGEGRDGDADVIYFTFRRPPDVDLASLPQDTTLQRAVVGYLRRGGHFQVANGYVDAIEEDR